jgi:hypothetical protein
LEGGLVIGAARRYREMLTSLLMEREIAGGSLPEEDESRYVEELDRCWWAMSDADQQEVERAIAGDPVAAPAQLDLEDVRVERGQRDPPRKAA